MGCNTSKYNNRKPIHKSSDATEYTTATVTQKRKQTGTLKLVVKPQELEKEYIQFKMRQQKQLQKELENASPRETNMESKNQIPNTTQPVTSHKKSLNDIQITPVEMYQEVSVLDTETNSNFNKNQDTMSENFAPERKLSNLKASQFRKTSYNSYVKSDKKNIPNINALRKMLMEGKNNNNNSKNQSVNNKLPNYEKNLVKSNNSSSSQNKQQQSDKSTIREQQPSIFVSVKNELDGNSDINTMYIQQTSKYFNMSEKQKNQDYFDTEKKNQFGIKLQCCSAE